MIQQRTFQPHPAVAVASAHFARRGRARVDDLRTAEVGTSDQRKHSSGRDRRGLFVDKNTPDQPAPVRQEQRKEVLPFC
jgi:hypothetical protein